MNVAQHAQRILAAWNGADPVSFEKELASALVSCRCGSPRNHLELEQQEVLESVIEKLQADPARRSPQVRATGRLERPSSQSLSAGFALLAHLSDRVAA
jgi:hypothetical protein